MTQHSRGYGEYGYDAFAGNGYSCEDIYPVGFKWNKGDYGYTSPPYSYPGSYCVQDYSDDEETMINERDEYTLMGTYNYNFDNGVTLKARAFYYESESFLIVSQDGLECLTFGLQHLTQQDKTLDLVDLLVANNFGRTDIQERLVE
jgi:hypothetical protein